MSVTIPELPIAPPPRADELITDDGVPMETMRHRQQMQLLIDSLEASYHARDDFFVGGNMFVYFSLSQAKHNDFRGPDVFVVLGTEPQRQRNRKAWVVWEEGGKAPDVVIELMSESTAAVDRGEKKAIYAQALKVAEYFLFDPFSLEFEGFTLDSVRNVYVPKTPNAQGWLCCERLGLWLGMREAAQFDDTANWLRWIDDEGKVLGMAGEVWMARAREEKARADEEKARADALARELAELRERAGR